MQVVGVFPRGFQATMIAALCVAAIPLYAAGEVRPWDTGDDAGAAGARAFAAPDAAPGEWSLSPRELVSGEETPLQLRYVQGHDPLPPGAYHRLRIEPVSVQTLRFCPPSVDIEVVPWNGPAPVVELRPSPVHGVGFREVRMVFPEGLEAGASFALSLGNRNAIGNIMALVNPVPVRDLTFETYTGVLNGPEYSWLKQGWTDALPKVDILPAPAEGLRLFAPSLVQTGEAFGLRLSVVDAFDSRAHPPYGDAIELEGPAALAGLPEVIGLRPGNECVARISGLALKEPGVFRIRARLGGDGPAVESNPIVVRDEVNMPIYWGTLHNHSWYSECWGDALDVTYAFARDVSGYDFFALSDHRGSVPEAGRGMSRLLPWRLGRRVDSLESWRENVDKANAYNRPGEFVTLIGYEYSCQDIGHHNVYVPEAVDRRKLFPEVYRNSAFELYDKAQAADALFIPHAHAGIMPFTRLDLRTTPGGHPLTPVYEVYSDWGGAFEPYGTFPPDALYGGLRNPAGHSYLWALDRGYKLGVISDTDTHTGLPGRRTPAGIAPEHSHPQGLTAARMASHTRAGLMDAYRQRRTYGTTGARIFLEVEAHGAGMGETLRTDSPCDLHVTVAGTAPIARIEVFQGLTSMGKRSLEGDREGAVAFPGLEPDEVEKGYAVVVEQEDGHRAWSSPIWVRKESVPDLAWSVEKGGAPALTNQGPGRADNVVVVHSDTEHPFANEGIAGYEPPVEETAGYLWTVPKDDHTVAVYYRWRGSPISGRARIRGAEDYSVDFCREWFLTDAEFEDDGQGDCAFYTGTPFTRINALGMDFLVTVDPGEATTFTLEFGEPRTTYVGTAKKIEASTAISLDGRESTGPLPVRAVVSLGPGESWAGPAEQGYWAADPANALVETDESNNLLRLDARAAK